MVITKKILLHQHIGAPCEPCVKRGDEVKSGTLIAKPTGLGANIFSSVDGKVDKVTKEFILVKQNKEFKTGTDQKYKKIRYKKDDILDAVRAAGLVGLGGAGFPTAIKLDAKLKDGYVLVNAAECEPLIEHNMAQIRDYPEKTISGIKYCMKASGATKAVIAIKEKHKEEIEILNKHIDGKEISIHLLPDLYPSGEERAIIRDVLGILLEPTQLPLEANCVVANIETVYRVAQAVEDKRPLITKNLTVAGKLCKEHGVRLIDIRGNDLLIEKKVVYDFNKIEGYTKADLIARINKVEVVSFDLFDTLVIRSVISINDIFEILESRLKDKWIGRAFSCSCMF